MGEHHRGVYVIAITISAFAARVALFSALPIERYGYLNPDIAGYALFARNLGQGSYLPADFFWQGSSPELARSVFPPGVPIMMLIVHTLLIGFFGFVTSGQILDMILGSLLVPLLYRIGSVVYGEKVGLLSTLVAFLPFQLIFSLGYSPSEVPTVFFVLLSLLFLESGLRPEGLRRIAVSGFLAGFSILVKYVAAALLVAAPLYVIATLGRRRTESVLRILGVWLSTLFLTVSPWLWHNYVAFGNPFYTSYATFVSISSPGEALSIFGISTTYGLMMALSPVLYFPLLLTLALTIKQKDPGRRIFLLFSVSFSMVFVAFFSVFYSRWYDLHRELVVLAPLLAVPAAAGLQAVAHAQGGKFIPTRQMTIHARKIAVSILLLTLALSSAYSAIKIDQIYLGPETRILEKSAGWISENTPKDATIATIEPAMAGWLESITVRKVVFWSFDGQLTNQSFDLRTLKRHYSASYLVVYSPVFSWNLGNQNLVGYAQLLWLIQEARLQLVYSYSDTMQVSVYSLAEL